jgi:hypothetical protein
MADDLALPAAAYKIVEEHRPEDAPPLKAANGNKRTP